MAKQMTEVKLNVFNALVQQQKSEAAASKIDEINECLRLRERAVKLEASLKAPTPPSW